MAEGTIVQMELSQPLSYTADVLRADARPLRALFEDMALDVRSSLQSKGVTEPVLEAALDFQYAGQDTILSVPFPLEIESAAVCLADPLPLDAQALRQSVEAFYVAYAERHGYAARDEPLHVVMLRVRGRESRVVSGL